MQNRPKRNLQSVPGLLDKAASSLFRWAITDHSGIGKMHKLMPKRGFLEELQHTLVYLLIAIFGGKYWSKNIGIDANYPKRHQSAKVVVQYSPLNSEKRPRSRLQE